MKGQRVLGRRVLEFPPPVKTHIPLEAYRVVMWGLLSVIGAIGTPLLLWYLWTLLHHVLYHTAR